ncbi:hypothetical protein [Intrasporangium sp.]|uniref:hypothetical protein n=1 Tax=Intrasporangium sp. TaxID=1925024 RepID=UPI003221AA21
MVEYADARLARDYPEHWGEPEGGRSSMTRIEWVRRNIVADDATGVPAARRARRILEERGPELPTSVYAALAVIRNQGGLGPKE